MSFLNTDAWVINFTVDRLTPAWVMAATRTGLHPAGKQQVQLYDPAVQNNKELPWGILYWQPCLRIT